MFGRNREEDDRKNYTIKSLVTVRPHPHQILVESTKRKRDGNMPHNGVIRNAYKIFIGEIKGRKGTTCETQTSMGV
jgi:hypothetical protein